MKAVRIHAYGTPEVLTYEDAPRPTPAEGEVPIHMARMQNLLSPFYKIMVEAILKLPLSV